MIETKITKVLIDWFEREGVYVDRTSIDAFISIGEDQGYDVDYRRRVERRLNLSALARHLTDELRG